MSKREPPSQGGFDKLLAWLDSDRDKAVEKYQRIYLRLVRIFATRGRADAEDLADQTFNVVASKIDQLVESYQGEPALFFYGVGKKIYQESLKPKPLPPPSPPRDDEIERRFACLEECLQKVTIPDEAKLVLRYHEGEGQSRIENRKQIAAELGITMNALRIRICHIQGRLRPCIEECYEDVEG
jgi:DNA-directed RNA polymerase specialized sigma24 family protein